MSYKFRQFNPKSGVVLRVSPVVNMPGDWLVEVWLSKLDPAKPGCKDFLDFRKEVIRKVRIYIAQQTIGYGKVVSRLER